MMQTKISRLNFGIFLGIQKNLIFTTTFNRKPWLFSELLFLYWQLVYIIIIMKNRENEEIIVLSSFSVVKWLLVSLTFNVNLSTLIYVSW